MMFLWFAGVLLVSVATSACSETPLAPVPPPPVALPAAPQAVLSVGESNDAQPITVSGWPLVFDGSKSDGAGPLKYRIELGEGSVVLEPTVTRVLLRNQIPTYELTAKLTVTDTLGRTATTAQPYLVGALDNGSGTFWVQPGQSPGETLRRRFNLKQNGLSISGSYTDYTASRSGRTVTITGRLTSQRTFVMTTDNGEEEFNGSLEFNDNHEVWPVSFFLRLVGTKGPATGVTIVLSFADPY